ncbi:M28 family metallopeptidase [Chitinophaga vietnamensis]|uniref:M28 family metallopeptidase n=1 Tax=Chitinophaga vietnamensis TaxID=2593957 RepID=UPI00117803F8|nr:M28 family peptidase [Chitinophaga vietnamensis]
MKKTLVLLMAAGSLAVSAFAQNIKEKDVARVIGTLAADDMQGRKPGTPGAEKAANFIAEEFRKAGLQPIPGEQSYRQEFNKYSLRQNSVSFEINGVKKDWPVAVVGKARNIDWKRDTSAYKEYHVKDLRTLFSLLRKTKSLEHNTLIWLSESLQLYMEHIQSSFSEKFYNSTEEIDNQEPAETRKNIVVVLEKEPVSDNDTWQVNVSRNVHVISFANIAGMIRGSSKPEEYVIFSGHYDHLGILPAMAGDSIANGADDDASGTTAVIMLAHYFGKQHPARSIIFVAFTAEETGGQGSEYFSRKLDPAKLTAMFNIEMIGKESKFGKNNAFITGFDLSDFGKILQRNLTGSSFHFYPDPYPEQHLFYRSDNATLARLGVPAHTISTTQIDKDKFYHTVGDEINTLDMTNIADIIKAIAVSAGTIINGTDTPTRIKPLTE